MGPLCCDGSGWGRTVCLVLHRWTGSQRAATLWEQLHQRAGVCVCVVFVWGRWVCLMDVTVVCVWIFVWLRGACTHLVSVKHTYPQVSAPTWLVSQNQKTLSLSHFFIPHPFILSSSWRKRLSALSTASDWLDGAWTLMPNWIRTKRESTPCRQAQLNPRRQHCTCIHTSRFCPVVG